ncbi:helix-turn-helix transcriptional regulator [Delftia acidovorans]|uniref:Helix-turn-helix transcriptional regulator n=1 Tax=Delftia acidovorans TaxID=80866 RepID=A0AAJ2R1W0_DELAC|nr:helix-turn-helix transcriptional regulator [Delftia acidovorans]MDX4956136.1 helix-turn-helix transcriptional regulator [Delftia acidovorans]
MPAPSQRYTTAQLDAMRQRHGFSVRFLSTVSENDCIFEGQVQEHQLPSGLQLVSSDIRINHGYESTSEHPRRFTAVVLLDGQAELQLPGARKALSVTRHAAAAFSCGDTEVLKATHAAGQTVRGFNLSIEAPEACADAELAELLHHALRQSGPPLHAWSLPEHLAVSLRQLLDGVWSGSLARLHREGIALQVLACALQAHAQPRPAPSPRIHPRDRRGLERVRECMDAAPGQAHSLDDLARLACMSPTTLREKFQAAYGQTVFGWLRERRMQLARERLAQGWSVQEAADCVGFQHASNFATAFRQRFGHAPSQGSLRRKP